MKKHSLRAKKAKRESIENESLPNPDGVETLSFTPKEPEPEKQTNVEENTEQEEKKANPQEAIFKRINEFVSSNFTSPFTNRSMSISEKLKIAASDVLYFRFNDDSRHQRFIRKNIFDEPKYPNGLDNASLAVAKAYVLMAKLESLIDDDFLNKYQCNREYFLDNINIEGFVLHFTLDLILRFYNTGDCYIPIRLCVDTTLKSYMSRDIRSFKQVSGDSRFEIHVKNDVNCDAFINSCPDKENAKTLCEDLVNYFGSFNYKVNAFLYTCAKHNLSDDLNLKECEMCYQFGHADHCCDMFEENFDNVSKDEIFKTNVSEFNHIVDRYDNDGRLISEYRWDIISLPSNDKVFKLLYNEMHTDLFIVAIRNMLMLLAHLKQLKYND
jgi:hypothetical protein